MWDILKLILFIGGLGAIAFFAVRAGIRSFEKKDE
jgi:hypothetical protein